MNQVARIRPPATADRPHVVVIGAGFGGLATAARLCAKGYRVTVLEKLDASGGRAYVFRRDGYVFDAGPTIITAPQIFERLWTDCGASLHAEVDLRPCDPFYKLRFDDGSVFEYRQDRVAMEEEVRRFCPADLEGYRRFMVVSERIYKRAYEDLAEKPFHSIAFTAWTLADILQLGGYRTVFSEVKRYFSDPRLQIVFSFHPLLIGGNPFTATSIYCLIAHLESKYGVHYVVGGTNALVKAMENLIVRQGGTVRHASEVVSIETQGRRATGVRLACGEFIKAEIIVSNAEPAWTYSKLLASHKKRRWTDSKIARSDFSMGLFVWYFGTRRRFEDVGHHTILLGPRYKPLLDDVFRHKRLADDFSLYLHRPTASDPSLAPPGHDAFYVLSPVPNLSSGTDWPSQAENYRRLIEQRLETTMMPGLRHEITTSIVMTPADFRDRLNAWHGAAFAMEPKLFQSAWFRPHNKSEELENLYLVGAGTHPGAGLPGVLGSAQIVADLIPQYQPQESHA